MVLSLPWESCRFSFALLRMCSTFLFHFDFFILVQTVKANRLENLESFWTVLVFFMILRQGPVFMRITLTVVTCQNTLTVMTVARGQVAFAQSSVDHFDGESTELDDYLSHFERVARWNGWYTRKRELSWP